MKDKNKIILGNPWFLFLIPLVAVWNSGKEANTCQRCFTFCSSRCLSTVFSLAHSSEALSSVLKLSQRKEDISEMLVILYFGRKSIFCDSVMCKNLLKGIRCDNSGLWIDSFCSIALNNWISFHSKQVSLSLSFMIKNLYIIHIYMYI